MIRFLQLLLLIGLHGPAFAADAPYPVRPLEIVVPFPPGGVADIVARAVAPGMERSLGKAVVVINRPGAGGTVGAAAVAHAAADGHTLLMALASISRGGERWEELPGLPTVGELRFAGGEYTLWSGLFVRAGTPDPVVAKIREAIRATASDPGFRAAMARLHVAPAYLDAPEFGRFWKSDATRLVDTVRRMGKLE